MEIRIQKTQILFGVGVISVVMKTFKTLLSHLMMIMLCFH